MVCHCLLIETAQSLVLVDAGLGLEDVHHPRERIGRGFMSFVRPKLEEGETALRQIERLGFKAQDVRHIVLTHLDLDHAGGISDFPDARVHVFRPEHEGAIQRLTLLERRRYRPLQWSHNPRWAVHEAAAGESWNGFEAIRALDDKLPEVLLIPLVGHTRGHCGVAVRDGDGWLLHAGDAYFHHAEINPRRPRCPKALEVFQRLMAFNNRLRLENQARLRTLAANPGSGVRIFCAHDPMELMREQRFFEEQY
jgi:glyoxylase-like metal-dependent hydrolase (beta-lactamase superfamily II)